MRILAMATAAILAAGTAEAATLFLDTGNVTSAPGAHFNEGTFTGSPFRYEAERINEWMETDADLSGIWGSTSGAYFEQISALTISRKNGGLFDLDSMNVPSLVSSWLGTISAWSEDGPVFSALAMLPIPSITILATTLSGAVTIDLPGFNPGFTTSEPADWHNGTIYNSNPVVAVGLKDLLSVTITAKYYEGPIDFSGILCADYNLPNYRDGVGGPAGSGTALATAYCDGTLPDGVLSYGDVSGVGGMDFSSAYSLDGITVSVAAVPLPASLPLLAGALLGLRMLRRRYRGPIATQGT